MDIPFTFGEPLSDEKCRNFYQEFTDIFRVKFERKKPSTHGPVWLNLKNQTDWIEVSEFDDTLFDECYIYSEFGKRSQLFESSLKEYISYINRCDCRNRWYLYAVKKDFSLCVSWNGEDGNTDEHYITISRR